MVEHVAATGAVRFARVAGGASLALGLALLVGLQLELEAAATTAPLAAAAIALAGAALALATSSSPRTRRGSLVAGVAVAIGGAVGIVAGADGSEGPLPLSTAVSLLLIGAALALANAARARARMLARGLARAVGVIVIIRALTWLLGVTEDVGLAPLSRSMATPVAVGLALLALGTVLLRADEGIGAIVTGDTMAGLFARRLVPAVMVAVPLLALLALAGQRAGLYGAELGLALFTMANMVVVGAITWRTTLALVTFERSRTVAEQGLRDSEASLRTTLHSIGDAVMATDEHGRVVRMNPVAEALTGWSQSQAIGQPLADVFRIIDEQTRAAVECPLLRMPRDGVGASTHHVLLVARDGRERAITDSGSPIRGDDGRTQGVVLVFRDVTKARDDQAALRLSEARFARLRDSGIMGIVVSQLGGHLLEANEAFLRTTGYTPADISERRVRGRQLQSSETFARNEARRAERPASGTWLFEQELIRKDGSTVPVLTGTAMLDEQLAISFILDLTALKKAEAFGAKTVASLQEAEAQLRHAQKLEAVGNLAGGVAHDFNNLLSVILSYAELIADALPTDAVMRNDVLEIKKAGERAARLTGQLLAFSRRQVLQLRVVVINSMVADAAAMLERLIGEDIKLTFLPGADLAPVAVDPGQLEQVLLNLVVNARDALPRGGHITIATDNVDVDEAYALEHAEVAPGGYVMLSVSDDGVGMDRDTQARIFEPFFTTKEVGKGTGLGLAVVFGIVKQSGGTIWVYSEPGKGTTFKIYLPRAASVAPAPAMGAAVATVGGSETILVVEDEEQVRRIVCRVLRRHGYQVLDAANGEAALRVCAEHGADIALLLTDVVMPHMSGRELASQIGARHPAMKTVFMSGYTDDAIVRHGILAKGVVFLQKPVLPEVLLRKVREGLDAA